MTATSDLERPVGRSVPPSFLVITGSRHTNTHRLDHAIGMLSSYIHTIPALDHTRQDENCISRPKVRNGLSNFFRSIPLPRLNSNDLTRPSHRTPILKFWSNRALRTPA